ncbi:AAA-like domain-containing protein [Planktothrix pseudagardhii]|uniref:WD repeat-containing protein slr0143 n=1 Tax=Planktothrix pseudagardhii TaxID=132604 RepID=A0A9W4G752_9CYAN|nr:AAA-like domain-containing protein [Planktothrix pseudagardhii]CAD5963827.1 putative WD repeat-containing protein slr0143 [Planktothrix pseudagardhii]
MLTEYQVGGSLHNNDPTYVVRACDHQLYHALKAGEFCYIFNSRQMGKSSLLVRTKHQLETEGYCCAVVDMTQIVSQDTTPLQWYKGIMMDLLRGFRCFGKLNFKTWWQEQEGISLVQKLSKFLEILLIEQFPEQNLCIFIDEIDSLLSLNFAIDDFFALIRACYNQRAVNSEYKRLTFALFGVATPSDLIANKTRTPFNIGTAIDLTGFTLEEATPLAEGLIQVLEQPKVILQEVLNWTNGQPFLTQKLFKLLLLNYEQNLDFIAENSLNLWIKKIVRSQIIEKWESQDEPEHLRTIRDRLIHNPKNAGRLLGIYQTILQGKDIETNDNREQIELFLSGLMIKHQGYLKVRNLIYQEVFNLEWVQQQLAKLRPYSQTFDAWIASGQQDESRLLRGQALKDAQLWSHGKSLSDLDYNFLSASQNIDYQESQQKLELERAKAIEAQFIEEQKNARLQRLLLGAISLAFLLSSGLGFFAFKQYKKARISNREARISEIKALVSSSKGLFASNHQLDAMIDAIKAKRRLESLGNVDGQTKENVEIALRKTVYGTNEFNRLIGHKGVLLGVAISPNDQLIATASMDNTVKIWQRDGKLLNTLNHSTAVTRVAFSPDSQQIVSGSLDGTVQLWRVDGSLVKSFPAHQTPVWGVAFSPDGKRIASASTDKTIKLWDLDARLLHTFPGHQLPVWNVAFSSDGKLIASASLDNTVKLWSLDGQLLHTLKGHQNAVWDVAFCSQGNLLVSGSGDHTAKIWKTDGTLVKTLISNDAVMGVDCRGEYIATGGKDNQVKLWHIDGTFIKDLKQHDSAIRDIAMSSDGLMVASASVDRTVKLWKRNQHLLKPLYEHKDTIWDIATSPDGKLFATVSEDNTLKLWHTDGKLWQTVEQPQSSFRAVIFSPDSRFMVTGSNNYTVQLWDVSNRDQSPVKLLRTFKGHQATVFALAIAPNSKIIATGGDDRTIKIWNLDGKLLHNIQAHKERIGGLAFSRDGQLLVSSSQDGTVKLWQADGKPVKTLTHSKAACWGVAFSPQGNFIASVCQDRNLKLWKLDGTLLKTIQTERENLTEIAFSPDGQIIAIGSLDSQVELWSLEGKLLKSLPGNQGWVMALAFTADGKFLISGGDDRTVILWDIKKILHVNELEYACDWVRDYLRTNLEVEERDRPNGTLREHSLCP